MLKPTPRVEQPQPESVSPLTLRALFDSEESSLLRYAFSMTGRRAVAEDIVQEVFLQLHAHWDEIDCPKAWLTRCVRNLAINHLRKHNREVLDGGKDEAPDRATEDQTPEAMISRVEEMVALRAMIDELSEADQTIVKLKYFENQKYREISTQTGLSVGNVGYRLHHILKELAKKLRPLGIEDAS